MIFEPKRRSRLIAKSFLQKCFSVHWNSTKWGCIHLQAEHIALAKDRINRDTTNLNVKIAMHRNLVPNCQNIWQKQVTTKPKSHIGKPFTMREWKCKTNERCQSPPCLVKHVLRNICLVTKHRRSNAVHRFDWKVGDHFKHYATKWSQRKPKQQI